MIFAKIIKGAKPGAEPKRRPTRTCCQSCLSATGRQRTLARSSAMTGVSVAKIRPGSRKSVRPFKGIICDASPTRHIGEGQAATVNPGRLPAARVHAVAGVGVSRNNCPPLPSAWALGKPAVLTCARWKRGGSDSHGRTALTGRSPHCSTTRVVLTTPIVRS
jgi:hypothetical protein